MNHPESAWDFIANIFGNTDVGESSSRNPWGVSNSMLPEPEAEFMTSCSWQYLSDSISVGGAPVEDLHHFQNTQLPAEISVEAAVEQESSQRKRNSRELDNSKCLGEENCKRKQIEKPKPKRRAEVHTMSERKRRERIRGKIRALQELTPNCTKGDKASILDDVIKYIKSLKLQVEMMSMGLGRGGLLQVPWPYMSEAGIQSSPVTPFIQMSPGMCFVYSSSQSQFLMPTPSPLSTCFQLQSPYPGTPLMYGGNSGTRNVPLPQLQMPFIHPQLPPTNTVLPPNPVFNHSSQTQSQGQGEIFTAQHMPTTPIVCHQLPITSQLQDSRRKPQT